MGLCQGILDHIREVHAQQQKQQSSFSPQTSAGGRICIHFDALRDPSNQRESIFEILTELRVHAIRKGYLNLWDKYVKAWIGNVYYDKKLPLLPENALLHLTSSDSEFSERSPLPRGMALRLPLLDEGEKVVEAVRTAVQEELGSIKGQIAQLTAASKENIITAASKEKEKQDLAQVPRACGALELEPPPKWLKDLETDRSDAVDPFSRGSEDPRGSGEAGAAPAATSEAADRPPAEAADRPAELADLVAGTVPDAPWQFDPIRPQKQHLACSGSAPTPASTQIQRFVGSSVRGPFGAT